METNLRSISGGGILFDKNEDAILFIRNDEGKHVTATVKINKLFNSLRHLLQEKFKGVNHAAAIYCYTEPNTVVAHWSITDEKMQTFYDVLPVDRCLAAITQITPLLPMNVAEITKNERAA
jgi:hypothetical protein